MKIRVAICQVDMEWENTARNLKRLEPIVAAADADVVVLPEMFATGFKLRPACVAEPADGLVVTTMRRWAAQYGRAVAGRIVARFAAGAEQMAFVVPRRLARRFDEEHPVAEPLLLGDDDTAHDGSAVLRGPAAHGRDARCSAPVPSRTSAIWRA